MEKITSVAQAVHHQGAPCGATSIYGVLETMDKSEVTCKTCIKCIGVKNEGHGKGDDERSKESTD